MNKVLMMVVALLACTSVWANESMEMTCNDGTVTFNSIGTDRIVLLTPDGDVSEEWVFQPEIYTVNGKKFSHGKSKKSKIKMIWKDDNNTTIEVSYTNGKLVKYNNCKH